MFNKWYGGKGNQNKSGNREEVERHQPRGGAARAVRKPTGVKSPYSIQRKVITNRTNGGGRQCGGEPMAAAARRRSSSSERTGNVEAGPNVAGGIRNRPPKP